MKRKILIIFLVLIVFILSRCSDNTNGSNSSNTNVNSKECNMGEVEIDGMCCRYIYKYPNKDGSCPTGYDDNPPSGGNRNVC
ncbi:MAG: hypothetical protein IKX00_00205 [Bacilli bacterium]|nr:hypothetical protein [Bacilli bacterium]